MSRGARGTGYLASLAFLLVLSVSARTAGAQERQDPMLPGCGIAYPGGYDVNTVGNVEGKLLDLQVPREGPVRFLMTEAAERWVVLTSPAWFWKMTGAQLAPGDVVIVRGSKTLGADGTLYLVAREIRSPVSGVAVVLRDRLGVPLWQDGARGGRMSGGSFGSGSGEGRGRGNNGGRGRR